MRRAEAWGGELLGHNHLGDSGELSQVCMRGLRTGDSLKVGGHLARFAEVILVGHIFDPKKKRSTAGQRWEINENLKSVNFFLRSKSCCVSA